MRERIRRTNYSIYGPRLAVRCQLNLRILASLPKQGDCIEQELGLVPPSIYAMIIVNPFQSKGKAHSFPCAPSILFFSARPDKAYQRLRWQPTGCSIPRWVKLHNCAFSYSISSCLLVRKNAVIRSNQLVWTQPICWRGWGERDWCLSVIRSTGTCGNPLFVWSKTIGRSLRKMKGWGFQVGRYSGVRYWRQRLIH